MQTMNRKAARRTSSGAGRDDSVNQNPRDLENGENAEHDERRNREEEARKARERSERRFA